MLIRRAERQVHRGVLVVPLQSQSGSGLDRRAFLRRSGLVARSLAALGSLPLASVQKAKAGPSPPPGAQVIMRKSICTQNRRYARRFEGMWDGTVDLNWTEQHHSLWLNEEERKGEIADYQRPAAAAAAE
jgi:hypothetical protein